MAGKVKDLVGKDFTRLTVMRLSHTDKKYSYWVCFCVCGKETLPIRRDALTSGTTRSCGCLNDEKRSEAGKRIGGNNFKDLSGQEFDYLIPQSLLQRRASNGGAIWFCLCKCGNTHEVAANELIRRHVTSCGCRTVSKLHEDTRTILYKLGINILKEEYVLPIPNPGLRLDFLVEVGGRLTGIECQGRQHYEPIENWGGVDYLSALQERDARKKIYLQELGIPLIEIRYDEGDIEDFLKQIIWRGY